MLATLLKCEHDITGVLALQRNQVSAWEQGSIVSTMQEKNQRNAVT